MNTLLDNPIQCPDDEPGLTCYDWHMRDNNPNNEPSDDPYLLDAIKRSRIESDNLPPLTPFEIIEAQSAALKRQKLIDSQLARWAQMWGNK